LWEAESGDLVVRLNGHAGDVSDVVFNWDGTLVATASEDGTARIWDASTGDLLDTLFGNEGGVRSVAFSPDSTTVATAGADGTVREYALGFDELVRIARSRLTRGISTAECQRYLHTSICPASVRPTSPYGGQSEAVADGPEGAFRVSVGSDDFDPALGTEWIDYQIGAYTLSMSDGTWRLLQEPPDDVPWSTSGTYTISGDTITLTDQRDPGCFGWTGSVRWALVGTELSFSDPAVDPAKPCGDDEGLAWISGVYTSRPWGRVVS
jgi:WD40 repeat protein